LNFAKTPPASNGIEKACLLKDGTVQIEFATLNDNGKLDFEIAEQ